MQEVYGADKDPQTLAQENAQLLAMEDDLSDFGVDDRAPGTSDE